MPETTLRALILGTVLGIVFAAANAYLGLYIGMTVSASIPAAVISMAILRKVFRGGTILENNIVQTIGNADKALNETLARSINTSLSTIIALLAILFFGSDSIFYFVLALTIGIGIGTYSSIFIAAPLLVKWNKRG